MGSSDERASLLASGENANSQEDSDVPKDRYNAAYLIFYLLGVGCLVPWNAFIMMPGYFQEKLGPQNKFYSNVLPYFTTGFQLTNITFLIIASNVGNRIPSNYRIGVPMFLQFIAFVGILLMVKINITGDDFFGYTFMLVIISAACTAFFQGGLFGLAGMLPFEYTQALMGGQGLGGVIVAGLNVLTLSAIPDDVVQAAFIFFIVAVAVLFFCVVSFFLLESLPIVHHYSVIKQPRRSSIMNSRGCNVQAPIAFESEKKLRTLFWELMPMAGPVFFIFVVSLAVFPAVGVKIVTQHEKTAKLFVPIYCFGGFALSDLVGRTIAPKIMWPPKEKPWLMKWPVLARVVLVPLMMLCDVQTGLGHYQHGSTFPVLLKNDAWPYAIMFTIGLTNGYFSTLCMMYGPSLVDSQESERAGFIMLLSLVVGLLVGSTAAFPILAILCNCNSFVSG